MVTSRMGQQHLPLRALDRLEVPGERYESSTSLSVSLTCSQVACKCPITKQNDWGTVTVDYEPGKWLVETGSLQEYLKTFQEVSILREGLVQQILDTFVEQIEPLTCNVTGVFKSDYSGCTREGLVMEVSVDYYRRDDT